MFYFAWEITIGVEMARIGDEIENPLTGERITFLETAASTGGRCLRFRLDVAPGGRIPNLHVHPSAQETFEIADGRVQIRRAHETWVADTGETVIVPPGVAHVWGNPFDEPAAVIVELRPALRAETMFETMFGLARDGKVDPQRNMPKSLLQIAVLHDFHREITLPGFAGVALRGVSALLAPIGRALGYRSSYPQYSGPESP
ncbi:cupin [Mycolicibacterium peregrinum]|uniref:Cupin n=1 Tax=Mycolicibacterium peregrinum TaxID=43304 RepID=A0A1A0QPS5_MYCPR|nr:cupin domain-containing protein [Mycolicibacterium peregrinum]OBB24156.1 cupin [Mycolicibacterium peregrinum]